MIIKQTCLKSAENARDIPDNGRHVRDSEVRPNSIKSLLVCEVGFREEVEKSLFWLRITTFEVLLLLFLKIRLLLEGHGERHRECKTIAAHHHCATSNSITLFYNIILPLLKLNSVFIYPSKVSCNIINLFSMLFLWFLSM